MNHTLITENACVTCRFFVAREREAPHRRTELGPIKLGLGHCRRFPQTVPKTGDDTCGEHVETPRGICFHCDGDGWVLAERPQSGYKPCVHCRSLGIVAIAEESENDSVLKAEKTFETSVNEWFRLNLYIEPDGPNTVRLWATGGEGGSTTLSSASYVVNALDHDKINATAASAVNAVVLMLLRARKAEHARG